MGFLSVAVGIEVSLHDSSIDNIFRLIATPDSWSINDGIITFVLRHDLVPATGKFPDWSVGTVIQIDESDFTWVNFKHRQHEWISFGLADCCSYMMCIAYVSYDKNVQLTDEQLETFLRLKAEFIEQGRLPSDSKLTFRANCCS